MQPVSSANGSSKNGSGRPPENDYGVPLQQIIQMGEAAARLLNSPIYNTAHQMAVNQAIQDWAATQPKEREKREGHWAEVQALGRVAQTMAGMVERAQQAVQNQNEAQANAESDFLDRQGFGLDENMGAGSFN